jgi:hypothetical protein
MVNLWKQAGITLLILSAAGCFAADKEHATVIREATLYVSPGANSTTIAQAERGSGMVVLERTDADNQPWLKVFVTLEQAPQTREVTGWLPGKAVITTSTPNGDQVVYGQAVDSEHQAEERGGRKGAAQDALRLYSRMAELFPGSSLAPESAWRAADIRWQLARNDFGKPLETRFATAEKYIQDVIAKFPQSRQADLAAYDLLETKLCPDWNGLTDCPLKESAIYEQYAREHPQSTKTPEALFKAAWRQAAVTDIYRINNNLDKSEAARRKAMALAQEIATKYPDADWKPRASDLIYKLDQRISVFSAAVDAGETK